MIKLTEEELDNDRAEAAEAEGKRMEALCDSYEATAQRLEAEVARLRAQADYDYCERKNADAEIARLTESLKRETNLNIDAMHDATAPLLCRAETAEAEMVRRTAERDAFFEAGIRSAKRLNAEVERLTEERDAALSRRGGECKVCGCWVCPPLTCYGCQAGLPPDDLLRRENQSLTIRAEIAEAALRELIDAYDAWDAWSDSDTYLGDELTDKVNARCDRAEADARDAIRAVGGK